MVEIEKQKQESINLEYNDCPSYRINNIEAQQLAGFVRIFYELENIVDMAKDALKEKQKKNIQGSGFINYQGLIITYRKCFKTDARRARIDEKKHLKNLSEEQIDIHSLLMHLGNKLVAHTDEHWYDYPTVYVILDKDKPQVAKAIEISVIFAPPLTNVDFENIIEMISVIKSNIEQEIEVRKRNIIDRYNHGKISLEQLCGHQANNVPS